MELLESGQLMGLIEDRKIIPEEFPIEILPGQAGVAHQQMDVVPVSDGTQGIIAGGLDFQSNEVFEVDDRNRAVRVQWQSLRPLQHTQSGGSESVEKIDTPQGGASSLVVADIGRAKGAIVTHGIENPVTFGEIVGKEDEIQVQSGALDTAHGHGHSTDQRESDAPAVKGRNDTLQILG